MTDHYKFKVGDKVKIKQDAPTRLTRGHWVSGMTEYREENRTFTIGRREKVRYLTNTEGELFKSNIYFFREDTRYFLEGWLEPSSKDIFFEEW